MKKVRLNYGDLLAINVSLRGVKHIARDGHPDPQIRKVGAFCWGSLSLKMKEEGTLSGFPVRTFELDGVVERVYNGGSSCKSLRAEYIAIDRSCIDVWKPFSLRLVFHNFVIRKGFNEVDHQYNERQVQLLEFEESYAQAVADGTLDNPERLK